MQEVGPTKRAPVTLGNMMTTVDDADPITNGGGRVFETSHGAYFEYTMGTEVDDDELEVYGVHLTDNVFTQFAQLLSEGHLETLCEILDEKPSRWKKLARGTLKQRAACVLDLANYFGWEKLDDEPLVLDPTALQLRWFAKFNEEGPATTTGLFAPPELVPELLIVLHAVSPARYNELFSPRFPLVPSEAIHDRQSSWWTQHGVQVVQKLVEALKDVCPPGFVFEVRDRQFGYWAVDGS